MKSMSLFVLGIFATLMVFVASCHEEHENAAPVLTISEPLDGATFVLTDSVHIEADASDDESLHEMSVLILSHMGDTVFADYPTVHELVSYQYQKQWYPADTGMYHLHMMVMDHDDATDMEERMFQVNP